MAPVSYTDFVKALQDHKDGSVTHNWDVAVTYEASQINALLATEHKKDGSRLPSKLALHYDDEDFDGNKLTQNYELVLGPPLIQFNAESSKPSCSLEMAVRSGSIWKAKEDGTKGKVTPLDADTYSIRLSNLALGAVTASDKAPVPTIKDPHLIVFPDASTTEHIVVDFVTNGAQVVIEVVYHKGEASAMPPPMKRIQLLNVLRDWFQLHTSAIDYTLAVINNTKPQTHFELDLVPRAFRFVCTGKKERSYLTLLIQTKASASNGNVDSIQSLWDGMWGGTLKVDPVPLNETASIIVNKSFIINQYLKAAINANKTTLDYTSLESKTLGKGESGFLLEFTWKTIFAKGKKDTNYDAYTGESHYYELGVDDRTIDPNQGGEKLNMRFSQGNGNDKPPTIHIKWSYKDRLHWTQVESHMSTDFNTGETSTWGTDKEGTLIGTYTLDKTVAMTGKLSQESFSIDVGIANTDWKFSQEAESAGWAEIFKAVIGLQWKSEAMPKFVSALAGKFITFNFDFGALRFFSVTNVLLPGKKVIDIDLNAGLRIPNDLVLVGNVVKEAGHL